MAEKIEIDREIVKQRIKARLEALNINQFEASKRAGKNPHFIYDFMIDRKITFKGDGFHRVAYALECSVDYLLGKTDKPGKPVKPSDIWREVWS